MYPTTMARGPMQLHRLDRLKVGPDKSLRWSKKCIVIKLKTKKYMNSGVARPSTARADHKSADLSTPQICLQEFKMKEGHVPYLLNNEE